MVAEIVDRGDVDLGAMPRLRASAAPSPMEVPARVDPRRPMAPVA